MIYLLIAPLVLSVKAYKGRVEDGSLTGGSDVVCTWLTRMNLSLLKMFLLISFCIAKIIM
jgi:hypothetical protein